MLRNTLKKLAALTLGGAVLLAAETGCEVYAPGVAIGPAPLIVGPYYCPYYGYYGYRYGYYGGWHGGGRRWR